MPVASRERARWWKFAVVAGTWSDSRRPEIGRARLSLMIRRRSIFNVPSGWGLHFKDLTPQSNIQLQGLFFEHQRLQGEGRAARFIASEILLRRATSGLASRMPSISPWPLMSRRSMQTRPTTGHGRLPLAGFRRDI
jgi:hypothetical protein